MASSKCVQTPLLIGYYLFQIKVIINESLESDLLYLDLKPIKIKNNSLLLFHTYYLPCLKRLLVPEFSGLDLS